MSSRGLASQNDPVRGPKPPRNSLPTPFIREFRKELAKVMRSIDPDSGLTLGNSVGIYCFFDYDGEPVYVGQTTEKLNVRVARHLTGQRTDAVAYRMLDPFEVASIAIWPINLAPGTDAARVRVTFDAAELAVYHLAVLESRFGAILNEKPPPPSRMKFIPPNVYKFDLIPVSMREERGHPDVRIARRSETLSRLAAVANERGEVSVGMRRVIVIQAIRIAYLAAERLAYVEGRPAPSPRTIDMFALVGHPLPPSEDVDDSDLEPQLIEAEPEPDQV